MFRIIVAAALLAFAPSLAFAKDDELRTFTVGGWDAAAYGDRTTGKVSNCVATGEYKSGLILLFALTSDYRWAMGISDPRWKLTPGEAIKISYSIDRRLMREVTGKVAEPFVVRFDLPDDAALFDEIRLGRLLEVSGGGDLLQFDLSGTARMLAALGACVTPPEPPARTSQAPKLVPDAPAASTSADDAELRIEAMSVATDVLQAGEFQGFRFERGKDVPEALRMNHAIWTTPSGAGMLRIFTGPEELDLLKSARILVDAQACKGKFASGAKPGSDASTATVFTTCELADDRSESFYVFLKRPEGGHYMFTLVQVGEESFKSESTPLAEASESLRQAALKTID